VLRLMTAAQLYLAQQLGSKGTMAHLRSSAQQAHTLSLHANMKSNTHAYNSA
jgi:hypothetical protein